MQIDHHFPTEMFLQKVFLFCDRKSIANRQVSVNTMTDTCHSIYRLSKSTNLKIICWQCANCFCTRDKAMVTLLKYLFACWVIGLGCHFPWKTYVCLFVCPKIWMTSNNTFCHTFHHCKLHRLAILKGAASCLVLRLYTAKVIAIRNLHLA